MENMLEMEAIRPVRQPGTALPEQLTPRQLDVLELLCEGLPNKLIGRRLNIASGTVKVHIAHILRTLNVSSRLQAVLAARSLGVEFKMRGTATVGSVHNPVVLRLVPDDDEGASYVPATDSDRSLAAAAG